MGSFGRLVRQVRSNDCGVEAYLWCEWSWGFSYACLMMFLVTGAYYSSYAL
jgi:hypothetical protein